MNNNYNHVDIAKLQETAGNNGVLEDISGVHAGKDTGRPQFFIVLTREQNKHLDGVHTVFGQVVDGMDIVNKIKQGDHMTKVSVVAE